MKNILMAVMLVLTISCAYAASGGPGGSVGSGTGAMPSSQAQTVLRKGYEACAATSNNEQKAFDACMSSVYLRVAEANRKEQR